MATSAVSSEKTSNLTESGQTGHRPKTKSVWILTRYARFVTDRYTTTKPGSSQLSNGVWKNWSSNNGPFLLSLSSSGHIVITQGSISLENIHLLNSRGKLKILRKADSMLFAVKLKNEVRRFRVMFSQEDDGVATPESNCIDCANAISRYFRVRSVQQEGASSVQETGAERTPPELIDGQEVSLSKIAKVLTTGNLKTLPTPCQLDVLSSQPDQSLCQLVRWCLMDPEFPSFVQQVEQELTKIGKEE